jgi:hypothetical protein
MPLIHDQNMSERDMRLLEIINECTTHRIVKYQGEDIHMSRGTP